MKSKTLAAVVLASALALTACSSGGSPSASPTAASDKNPFDFLYIGGITGPFATLAVQELQGINVAIKQINAAGGINGRKVVLEQLDSKGNPTEAVSVLQKRLASGTKPDLIRTALSSTEALALGPITTRAKIPTYAASASQLLNDVSAYPYLKLISAPFSRVIQLLETYTEAKKYKTLGVLAPQDASGDAVVTAVQDQYKGTGTTIQVTRYNASDLDLSIAYQKAFDQHPDAIYGQCLGAPCKRIVAARSTFVGGNTIPMIGDTSMSGAAGGIALGSTPEQIKNLNVIVFKIQLAQAASSQTSQFKAFYKGIAAQATPVNFGSATSVAYDGLTMYAAAFNKAKSSDPVKVIKALNSIKFAPGAFVSYGNAAITYTADSTFPTIPDDGFAIVEASEFVNSQYPALNVYAPKSAKKKK